MNEADYLSTMNIISARKRLEETNDLLTHEKRLFDAKTFKAQKELKMTSNKTFHNVLLSKAIYSEFVNLVCDHDAAIRKNAIDCIVEGAKHHPKFFIELITERLSDRNQLANEGYFACHMDLLNEFIKSVKKENIQREICHIYDMLKEVVQTLTKPTFENQTLAQTYQANEEVILQVMEDLSKIDPEQHLNFVIRFIDSENLPDVFVIVMMLQLNKFHPMTITSNIVEIVSRIVPLLTIIKSDNMKFELVNLLVQIIETFLANEESTESYRNMTVMLSQLFSGVFEVVQNRWISDKLVNVKQLSFKLLGLMIYLLPIKRLSNQQEALLQIFINALKKENTESQLKILEFIIAQGFNFALEKYCKVEKRCMQPLVRSLTISLHHHFMTPILSANSEFSQYNLKYKNEITKTIQILGECFPNELFDYYLERIEIKGENRLEIISSLWILRHLITRFYDNIGPHLKKMLYMHLKTLCDEEDFEIRFVLLEVMLVLLTSEPTDVEEERKFLLQFLLRQVSVHEQEIKDKANQKSPGFETTLEIVASRSNQVLHILTSNKNCLDFLWPNVLNFIMIPAYSPGLPVILKNLNTLIAKNSETKEMFEKFSLSKIKPKSHSLFLRLALLCYIPLTFKNLGYEILQILPSLFKQIDDTIRFPSVSDLVQLLKSGTLKEENLYFDKLNTFIYNSIVKIANPSWCEALNQEILENISNYVNNKALIKGLCWIHGSVISKLERPDSIKKSLEKLFNVCHPEYSKNIINGNLAPATFDEDLRKSVAKGIGLSASTNFEYVIDFLNETTKKTIKPRLLPRSKVVLLAFSVHQGQTSLKRILKSLLSKHLDIFLITQNLRSKYFSSLFKNYRQFKKKFESAILSIIISNLEVSKSKDLKAACIKSLSKLSKALFKLYESGEEITEDFQLYIMKQRERIFQKTVDIHTAEKADLRYYAYLAQAYLSRIDPPMPQEFYFELLNEMISLIPTSYQDNYSFFMEPIGEMIHTIIYRREFKAVEGSENIKKISFWETFDHVLETIKDFSLDIEEPSYKIALLKKFMEKVLKSLNNIKIPTPAVEQMPSFLKSLIDLFGYSTISDHELRSFTYLCISKLLLGIGSYIDSSFSKSDDCIQALLGAISNKFSIKEIIPMLTLHIIDSMNSRDGTIFAGLNQFFNVIVEQYPQEIGQNLEKILETFFEILNSFSLNDPSDQIKSDLMENEMINSVIKLLQYHLKPSLNIMLKRQPQFPLSSSFSKCLQKIIQNKNLLAKTFNYLTDILNNPDQIFTSDCNIMGFNATIFFGVIMEARQDLLVSLTKRFFYQILGTFLLRFGTSFDYLDAKNNPLEKDAMKFALWSFQAFLRCAEDKAILSSLEGIGLQRKLCTDLDEGISELLMIVCKNSSWKQLKSLVDFLQPFLAKKIESQRSIVIIVIAQIIYSSMFLKEFTDEDVEFFEDFRSFESWIFQLLNLLLQNIESKRETIRKYCYRGIGNISYLTSLKNNPRIVELNLSTENLFVIDNNQSSAILKLLLRGMEDPSRTCIKEALASFQRVAESLNDLELLDHLGEISSKLRVSFESGDTRIRMCAFNLVGKVYGFLYRKKPEMKEKLIEEIHYNLISIFLHYNDESEAVRQACSTSLKELGEILGIPDLTEKIEAENKDKPYQHLDRNECILMNIAALIYEKFRINSTAYLYAALDFCKSPEDFVRGAAIFFVLGLLNLMDVSKSCSAYNNFEEILFEAFNDRSSKVRLKAVKGYSILTKIHIELNNA